MNRKNSILAMLLAVLMVIAMMPAVTQEAYAGEKFIDFSQYIDGLKDGNIVIGTTISVDVENVISAYDEMMKASAESDEVYVSLYKYASGRDYFEYNSAGIAELKVKEGMVEAGSKCEICISIGSEHFYATGIYVVTNNTLDVKGKTATVKYSKLKKKAQYLDVSKIMSFADEGQGEKTYTLASAKKSGKSYKKYFKINESTGKLTVKKGLKKGTYTVKAKVKAAGESNPEGITYLLPAEKTVTIKIKVK